MPGKLISFEQNGIILMINEFYLTEVSNTR